MSTFSFPEMMQQKAMMTAMPDVDDWMKSLPAGSISPLMTHPMAASAAAMAVGVGLAGQMMGLMSGSMQGALEASRRFGLPATGPLFEWPAEGFVWPGMPVAQGGGTEARRPAASRAAPRTPPAKAASAADKDAPAATAGAVSELKTAADAAADAVIEAEEKARPAAVTAKGAVAPEDFKRPAALAKPEAPDDLKQISGIGPKLEQVLNGLGVWRFSQIVDWSAQEVAWVDDYLQFKGRIARDMWQEQADKLAHAGK